MSYADALRRAGRADKMRSFYEPAFFGQRTDSYMDPLGFSREVRLDRPPSTLGGFTYATAADAPPVQPGLPGPGQLPPEVMERIRAEERAKRTRAAYSAPPVGANNMQNYGVGQLANYGVGSLQNYGTNAIPTYSHWRRQP